MADVTKPSDIEFSVSVDFTAVRIKRRAPTINEEAARRLAIELHDIVAEFRRLFALHPRDDASQIEETDVITTILQTAVEQTSDENSDDDGWLMGMLTVNGDAELFVRYLRVYDTIQGTDLTDMMMGGVDEPPTQTRLETLH